MFDYIEYTKFIDDEKRKKKKGPGIKKKIFFSFNFGSRI